MGVHIKSRGDILFNDGKTIRTGIFSDVLGLAEGEAAANECQKTNENEIAGVHSFILQTCRTPVQIFLPALFFGLKKQRRPSLLPVHTDNN